MAHETNPDTSSGTEMEPDGDFTVTFSMSLPTQPSTGDDGR